MTLQCQPFPNVAANDEDIIGYGNCHGGACGPQRPVG